MGFYTHTVDFNINSGIGGNSSQNKRTSNLPFRLVFPVLHSLLSQLATMSPDQAAVVRSFRQELEGASFGLGQVNDNELECWLFEAGADRVHLLQWCLSQLDPVLRDRFQNCDEKEAEESKCYYISNYFDYYIACITCFLSDHVLFTGTIEQVKSFGLCSKTDIILVRM